MPHHNSLFHAMLKHVPWAQFDALVDEHRADYRVRRLSTRSQFVALLYGQLAGATSLREIEVALASHRSRLYHLGGAPASRSTLADANATRPVAVFSGLFEALLARAGRGLRKTVGDAVHLIDSTQVRLSGNWARFSHDTCGAKVHIAYDPDADLPLYAAITPARVNDITPAKAMPIQPGATYIFDLGYYDYAWWARLHAAGCRIVTRLKANAPLHGACDRPLSAGETPAGETPGAAIISDRIGRLNPRVGAGQRNPMSVPVREVRVRIDTGRILRLVTNDLDAAPEDIAALYKRRWAIELFFRWVKQTLKIRHFLGTSENAVRIQILVALIAFVLLRMAQAVQRDITSPLAFARLVRSNLMHNKDPGTLLRPNRTAWADPRQIAFNLKDI